VGYTTPLGCMVIGYAEEVLRLRLADKLRGKVQLIFTSPPFPLNRKKKYGNLQGEAYIKWLAEFAPLLGDLLAPNGSIVIEVGNAWEPGRPAMSTLPIEALLAFKERGGFYLCQQFVCYNPARLPSPAQWVNVKRIRVKDAYTNLWWMSRVTRPFANNRRVLKSYSESMLKLLETKKYNAGRRPSAHSIGEASFLRNNKGAIPSNVLTFTNTLSRDPYLEYCRNKGLELHPARMPLGLAQFFIKFLTRDNGLVLDPFAGSNTTGDAAERLGRRWISIEPREDYAVASQGRFLIQEQNHKTPSKTPRPQRRPRKIGRRSRRR
jgi:DNA modification methylase